MIDDRFYLGDVTGGCGTGMGCGCGTSACAEAGLAGSKSKRLLEFALAQNAQIQKQVAAGDTQGAIAESLANPWTLTPNATQTQNLLTNPQNAQHALQIITNALTPASQLSPQTNPTPVALVSVPTPAPAAPAPAVAPVAPATPTAAVPPPMGVAVPGTPAAAPINCPAGYQPDPTGTFCQPIASAAPSCPEGSSYDPTSGACIATPAPTGPLAPVGSVPLTAAGVTNAVASLSNPQAGVPITCPPGQSPDPTNTTCLTPDQATALLAAQQPSGLSAPITLPLVGAVPMWGVLAAAAAGAFAVLRKKKAA